MIENFSLAHFRIRISPEIRIVMPRFNKGNVLRGAFGSSLKRLVCVTGRDSRCVDCSLKERCAYTLIFDPAGISPARRLHNAPRGYVLKPPLDEETDYTPEKPLSFDMILIGDRVDYLAYVIVLILELGKRGMGLNRGKFSLTDIWIVKDNIFHPVYDSETNTVRIPQRTIAGHELQKRAGLLDQHTLTLCFLTPTRIKFNLTREKGKSMVVRTPEFHHLVRRLRDRINALSMAYCRGPIDVDFRGIAERATAVRTVEKNVRWVEIKRRSRTQSVEHDQSGFIGTMTYEGEMSEFLPLIVLGEYVHIGEDAVFGNGWYAVAGSQNQ